MGVTAFVAAFLMVVVAEMGDKTQLLAMACAAKYSARHVMAGVFVATAVNHALAVLVGTYLSEIIPMSTVRIIAGVSFIFFGLWTLRGDKLDDDEQKGSKYGPVTTVAIAFFLAEMGDKTQLATVALAAQYKNPIMVLLGTTAGMMVSDGLGVLAGAFISKRLANSAVKIASAAVFIVFGFVTLYETLESGRSTVAILAILGLVTAAASYWLLARGRNGQPRC